MIEVVLIKKFNNNIIELINTINSINKSIRLFKIITNKEDFLNIITNNSINILIIDNNIFQEIDLVEFTNLTVLIKNIIILNNEKFISDFNFNNKYLFANETQLPKLLKTYLLNQNNDNTDHIDKNIIMKKISEELKYIGYNLSYCGTKYLIECIYYFYEHQYSFDENTIKSVYTILAKKYNKTENNIKCNITRATSIMFCECEENKLKKYLGLCSLPKTGSKIIIHTVLNKINYS